MTDNFTAILKLTELQKLGIHDEHALIIVMNIISLVIKFTARKISLETNLKL